MTFQYIWTSYLMWKLPKWKIQIVLKKMFWKSKNAIMRPREQWTKHLKIVKIKILENRKDRDCARGVIVIGPACYRVWNEVTTEHFPRPVGEGNLSLLYIFDILIYGCFCYYIYGSIPVRRIHDGIRRWIRLYSWSVPALLCVQYCLVLIIQYFLTLVTH